MKWNRSQTAAQNARAVLPKRAEKYFEAGRKATAKKQSPKALHRFRIATKRFRYSLELFRPVYGPTLERRLDAIRDIQQSLGRVSDYQTILKVITRDPELEADLEKRLQREIKKFRRLWREFDSKGQLKSWKAYLGRAQKGSVSIEECKFAADSRGRV